MNYARTGNVKEDDASLVVKWWHSAAVQGFALGAVLGPVGAFLAYVFSAKHNRAERSFAALKGSAAASVVILLVAAVFAVAVYLF
jgi:hypothetical protein